MIHLIDKDALVAEIEKRKGMCYNHYGDYWNGCYNTFTDILSFLDTLEVKDPYEQCVQYDSIKAGIQAHAETYSFNIESELFHQLTKEQQGLWRKEIEQACISGGEMGVELARDPRYKENLKVREVDLEKELNEYGLHYDYTFFDRKDMIDFAKHFFELGMQVSNKAQKGKEV